MNSSLKLQARGTAGPLPERFLFGAFLASVFLAVYLAGSKFDGGLLLGIYQGAASDSLAFWKFISGVGSNWSLAPIVVIFAALFSWRGRHDAALWLVAGWLTTTATVELLKWLIERARPPLPILTGVRGASFPSGHAAESLFVFYYLWILLAGSDYSRHSGAWGAGLRDLCSLLLAVLPALVGYSRVYLGAHWPSDVLGGWAIGFFVLGIAYLNKPRNE